MGGTSSNSGSERIASFVRSILSSRRDSRFALVSSTTVFTAEFAFVTAFLLASVAFSTAFLLTSAAFVAAILLTSAVAERPAFVAIVAFFESSASFEPVSFKRSARDGASWLSSVMTSDKGSVMSILRRP